MAVNGVYIVQGELNAVVAQLRRNGPKWQPISDEQDPLLRSFADLRDVLNTVADLGDMSPSTFLTPFLEVIRSEQTSGTVTGQALGAVGKFLSYGLVDPDSLMAPSAVQRIAEAVTHARFVGTDTSSDEVVLLRIIQVLRTLLLTPVGALLTDEAVCEVLQSCFRICFERRLSELLRKATESCLTDMVQLLFTRLPTFVEDPRHPYIRRLKMRAGFNNKESKKKKSRKDSSSESETSTKRGNEDVKRSGGEEIVKPIECETVKPTVEGETGKPPVDGVARNQEGQEQHDQEPVVEETTLQEVSKENEEGVQRNRRESTSKVVDVHANLGFASDDDAALALCMSRTESSTVLAPAGDAGSVEHADHQNPSSMINEHGVKFTSDEVDKTSLSTGSAGGALLQAPYGLPSVRELLRFLISISNPNETQNSDNMMELGLTLLTVALEAGADHIGNYGLLLPMIQNELCKNATSMLLTPKSNLFAATLRVGFLCFEALRTHLKFQLESYLTRLMELVLSDSGTNSTAAAAGGAAALATRAAVERKEMALEALVQLWRVPGLVTELYLNYDCDLYCSNLFEELTKLLSKNAFPVSGLLTSTHVLSLDALLTVVDTIETNCHYRMLNFKEKTSSIEDGGSVEERSLAAAAAKVQSPSHMLPVASGFSAGKILSTFANTLMDASLTATHANAEVDEVLQLPQVRPNRMPISSNIPSHEDLIAQKQKKRLLLTGTDLFNQTPSKGVGFLQEHGLLRAPLVPRDAVAWIKENPRLDKRKIAEYIINRKNTKILEAFVQSFDFAGLRVDEALRLFVETFRLPGEAAEISMVIEHFADHWYKSNGNQFASVDAAFTLAYAVIMLNVDQHNQIAKRQQQPMTVEAFKKNLTGVNGGANFEPSMLEEMYKGIRDDEIIMPAEQSGVVKENYLWKLLLKRGQGAEGRFIHAPSGLYDHDLFALVWGPTVAALSYVFDKSADEAVILKTVGGYRKCAAVAAHYGMSDVFDNLIINLCKFSTLLTGASTPDFPEQLGVEFGDNAKAQAAAKAMFQLVHAHGDILREGWKNLSECLLQLYRANLLPDYLTQVEDFSSPKGWTSIVRRGSSKSRKPKSDAGLFSSLYNYLGGTGETKGDGVFSSEDQKLIKHAREVVAECRPEQLVFDSKYLTGDALSEMLKALVVASAAATAADSSSVAPTGSRELSESAEMSAVFYLECVVSVCLENRDRLLPYWRTVRAYLFGLLTEFAHNAFLTERAVVGLLRLASRLLIREEIVDEVLTSLAMLVSVRRASLTLLARQVAFGLHELLRFNAANIHKREHWTILFTLLEVAGASAFPVDQEADDTKAAAAAKKKPHAHLETQSDTEESKNEPEEACSDRGYTSDSEAYAASGAASLGADSRTNSGEWLYVDRQGALLTSADVSSQTKAFDFDGALLLRRRLRRHDPRAFVKCCETLAFLVRDAAHITPENFVSSVQCLRTFVEASINGGGAFREGATVDKAGEKKEAKKRRAAASGKAKKGNAADVDGDAADDEGATQDPAKHAYAQVSLQLLDLVHTLHVKAASIYKSWAESSHTLVDASSAAVWINCWRPLLQAMARLCCDQRKQVRTSALTYLQRALLVHDLQQLTADEWVDCFFHVLFPLLSALMTIDKAANGEESAASANFDEARVRATTLMSKVFLQHLCPLSANDSFGELWLTILTFMEKYLRMNSSDLNESIPESVKNMLLVMDTAGLFAARPELAESTKKRLAAFLPELAESVLTSRHEPQQAKQDQQQTRLDQSIVAGGSDRQAPQEEMSLEEVVVQRETVSPPPANQRSRMQPTLLQGAVDVAGGGGAQVVLHPPAAEYPQIYHQQPIYLPAYFQPAATVDNQEPTVDAQAGDATSKENI